MKKNLITSLKKLLDAFGGDSKNVKSNAVEIVDKIADSVNESGGGSGGGVQPVTVEISLLPGSNMDGTWTGATWEELVNAHDHGVAFAVFNNVGEADYISASLILHQIMGNQEVLTGLVNSTLVLLTPDGHVELRS